MRESLSVFTLASPSIQPQKAAWARVRDLSAGRVIVTTVHSERVQGRVEAIDENHISIRNAAGERQIAKSDVRSIIALRRDSVWDGVLVGAAIGFGGGAGVGAAWFHGSGRYGAKPPGYGTEFVSGMGVIGSAVGALVGGRIDMRRVQRVVIYESATW